MSEPHQHQPADLAASVLAGDRAALARAITLLESRLPEHEELAQELLGRLLPSSGGAQRVGITGPPGVGKSTFIDALGIHLLAHGHRVAVLAVDPSSRRTGGSILGDKTRMPRLAIAPAAFVRPSPSAGTLGGVARRTREALLLCEAAGFDVVLVETVGTGQSETAVAELVDSFLVLALPGAGDELQGIKRGVLELADLLVVNKADGDNLERAERAASDLRAALRLLQPDDPSWPVPVLVASAHTGRGIEAVWETLRRHREHQEAAGRLQPKRQRQNLEWMWAIVEDRVLTELREDPGVRELLRDLEDKVIAGEVTPVAAARRLLEVGGVVGSAPDRAREPRE
jgi:LAO/AO transport system kinase